MNEQMPPAVTGPVEPTVMQHTPGPWRWWGCKDGSYNPMNDYAQIAAGSEFVAQVRLALVTEADLRLMVAAPKLLDALLTAEALLYAHGKPIDPAITAALVAAGARAA